MITVETGELEPGANSYASVADADTYHAARSTEAWPQFTPEPVIDPDTDLPVLDPESGEPVMTVDPDLAAKEAALVRATDTVNGFSYPGTKAKPGRVMAWPRLSAFDICDGDMIPDDVVPDAVIMATCYLASVILDEGEPQGVMERGGRISSESVSSLSSSYFDDALNRDAYGVVADLLKCYAFGMDKFSGLGDNAAGKSGFISGKVRVG